MWTSIRPVTGIGNIRNFSALRAKPKLTLPQRKANFVSLKIRPDLIGGLIVFVATFLVFRLSAVHQTEDSRYFMLASERLLYDHTFTVDPHSIAELNSFKPGEVRVPNESMPYQLWQIGDLFYSIFPPGTSILSAPYVATMNAFGVSARNKDGTHNLHGEIRIQAGLAALLMAGMSVIIFFTARLLLDWSSSLLVAFATAFGTQAWSTASRALWTDTWSILILALVLYWLLRAEVKKIRPPPLLLATCLSWLFFLRPTFAIPIAAITIYVLLYQRAIFVRLALTGTAWLGLFVWFSRYHFGTNLPPYYRAGRLNFENFREGLAGTLISPSRGLFIYVPVLLFVGYLLWRYRTDLKVRRLIVLAVGVTVLHVVMIAGFPQWWAGWSYGPRFTTSLVPFFALLAIVAIEAWLRRSPNHSLGRRAEVAVGTFLLVCSMVCNGAGAVTSKTARWNAEPFNVDQKLERLWDWRDAQVLRAFRPRLP
jgi:hypothetical protein